MIFHKPMEYHAFTANRSQPYNILITSFACFSDAMSFFEDKTFSLTAKQKKILALFMNEMKKGFLNEADNEAYQFGTSTFERLLIDLKRENQNFIIHNIILKLYCKFC